MNSKDKSKGFEMLICSMLRGSHIQNIKKNDLKDYMYLVGVALHNIPRNINENNDLTEHQLISINELDPTGSTKEWGHWVKCLSSSFGQTLPEEIRKNSELYQNG